MAKQNASLTLDELYGKEKITKAVEVHIIAKSDFSKINERYCDNICKLKCKASKLTPSYFCRLLKISLNYFHVVRAPHISSGILTNISQYPGVLGYNYRPILT